MKIYKKISWFLVFLLVVLSLPAMPIAQAAPGVPKILNYQGRLLSATGTLLGGASGASYCFKFSLYDAASSGSKVWPSGNPATSTITVTNGVFNAGVGDTAIGGDALTYDFQSTSTIFLEVQVGARGGDGTCNSGGDETMETLSPRQQVFSAGFAINSDMVDGFHAVERATSTQIAVLSNGELILGSSTPSVSATGTNALTFQNRSSGNINFFSSATATLTTAGTLTIAGLLQSTASGNSYFSGNLGVGVTSPSTRLEISGTASTTALFVSDVATTTRFYVSSSTEIVNNLTVDTNTIYVDASLNNVGIGTAAPNSVLDVRGDMELVAGATAWGEGLRILSGANTEYGSLFWGYDRSNIEWSLGRLNSVSGGGARDDLSLVIKDWTGSSLSGIRNDIAVLFDRSTGNTLFGGSVGIGTTSPGAKLDVAGTASSTGLIVNGIATTTNLNITSFTNGSVLFSTSSGLISQDNSNLFWDDTNNRLGIGTTTPASLLDVAGVVQLRGFSTGTTGLYVDGSGRVGIGTTAPVQKLDINGGIGLQESLIGIDSYTKLLLHTDGTDTSTAFTDATGKTVTANGNAQIDTAQSKFGGSSGLFDNLATSYASLADSDDWNFGSGNLTIDFWVRWNGTPTGYESILGQSTGGGNQAKWMIAHNYPGANQISFAYYNGATGDVTWSWAPSANTWYHVAIVRSGNSWYLFVDGVQTGGTQTQSLANADITTDLRIGADGEGWQALNGWLDEVRISKGIARWTADFTAPAKPYGDGVLGRLALGGYDSSSSIGNAALVVNGNVGIGTTTPQDALHVIGDIRTSACASDGTGDVACVDVAETYYTSEAMEAGDIVMIDSAYPVSTSSSFAIKKTEGGTINPLIGIVSTRPALLIEGDKARLGGPKVEGTYKAGEKAPIALVGRVPVKISEENGTIQAGDKLTASSQNGIAKKTTEAGWIVGIALEPSSHASSRKIMAFVNPVWWGGENQTNNHESGLLASITNAVKSVLNSLGLFIENGIARLEKLTAKKIEVTSADIEEANIGTANIKHLRVGEGIEFTDKTTGEPYCAWIENGELTRQKGACGNTQEDTQNNTDENTENTQMLSTIEEAAIVEEEPQNTTTSTVEI